MAIVASLTSWANFVYVYCNPNTAAMVQAGADMNPNFYSTGFTFTEAEPGETVYFGFSPYAGYSLTGIRYENLTSEDVTEHPNGFYSFTMPNAKVKIWLDFDFDAPAVTRVNIDEVNFPDANFRNWLLSQSYGADGVIAEDELLGITSIDVSSCGIDDLTGIEHFALLTQLDVSNYENRPQEDWNRITALDLSGNPYLRSLKCANNLITSINIADNSDLRTLDCSGNSLMQLDVTNNTNLGMLLCTGNQLTELDVTNNMLLDQLYCEYNQLTSIDVTNHSRMMILNCNDNQLTALDVSGCDELFQLYFYNNRINGQAMDVLVNSLPYTDAYLVVVDLDNEAEQNAMTKAQVATAVARGWSVEGITGDDFVPYEGIDDVTVLVGDVNLDGGISIADVTTLIDYLLSDASAAPAEADCNGDNTVSIADVTALIDYLLSGTW